MVKFLATHLAIACDR